MIGSKRTITISLGITVLIFIAAFIPIEGLDRTPQIALFIFLWAILMWILRPIPEFITAILAATILMIFFLLYKPSGAIVSPSDVLQGFSTTGWWLTLFATLLGGVITFTGIGYRLAYFLLAKLGNSHLKVMYSSTMACNILAAFTPSNTARGAIMSGLVDSICDSMGYKPGEYKGDHGIILANLYANTTNTWLFMTGTGASIIGLTIIEEMTGQTISWMGWLLATFIPAIIILMLIPLICYKLFPPVGEVKKVDNTVAETKLREMGPMSRNEKAAAVIMLFTFAMWATEQLHGISAAYVSFIMAALLIFPKIGACDWKDVESRIPWASLIWLGFAIGIASAVNSTGGFTWIISTLLFDNPIFQSMSFINLMLILLPVIVFIHIIFSGMDAMTMIVVPMSVAIAQAKGFDPFIVGLLSVMAISAGAFFLPFNSAPNLIFLGTGRFTPQQQLKGAIPIAILIVLGFIFCLLAWWPVIGLI